jgi:hypothetical protein
LQLGFAGSVQSPFDLHPVHASFVQTGALLVHCAFVVHCTHWPAFGSLLPASLASAHTGVDPEQSLFPEQGSHLFEVVLQIGVDPEQSEFAAHSTHVLFAVRHTGVGAAQLAFEVHPPCGPMAGFVSSHLLFTFDQRYWQSYPLIVPVPPTPTAVLPPVSQMSPISPSVLLYQATLFSPTSMSVIASASSCDDVSPSESTSGALATDEHPVSQPLPEPMSGMTAYGSALLL